MSTILILTPVVMGAWPVYASVISTVAASLGYKLLNDFNLSLESGANCEAAQDESVNVGVESANKIAATMKDGDSLKFTNGNYVVVFAKDPRGMCSCQVSCVSGKKFSKAVLEKEARKIVNKVTQTYVYNKLKAELAQKGYNIVSDEVNPESSIKLTVRKWK